MNYRAISGDSHVLEAPGTFQDRLPNALKEQGPRIIECEDGGQGWSWEGRKPRSFGLDAMAGKSDFKEFKDHGLRFSDLRKGNWEANAHLADQDLDRVDCSVLYPGSALGIASAVKDRELRLACIRAYNDWLLDDFQAVNPARLVALAILPIDDGMDEILKEMQRVAKKGCRGALLLTYPDKLYTDKYYEPLWAAASEMRMPLHFHRSSGKHVPRGTSDVAGKLMVAGIVLRFFAALEPITHILFTGALHRHPGLEAGFRRERRRMGRLLRAPVRRPMEAPALLVGTGVAQSHPASTSASSSSSPSWMTRSPAPTPGSPVVTI